MTTWDIHLERHIPAYATNNPGTKSRSWSRAKKITGINTNLLVQSGGRHRRRHSPPAVPVRGSRHPIVHLLATVTGSLWFPPPPASRLQCFLWHWSRPWIPLAWLPAHARALIPRVVRRCARDWRGRWFPTLSVAAHAAAEASLDEEQAREREGNGREREIRRCHFGERQRGRDEGNLCRRWQPLSAEGHGGCGYRGWVKISRVKKNRRGKPT